MRQRAFWRARRRLLTVVAIEDVLSEREAVNVPGTVTEHPNWQRKRSLPLEALASDGRLARIGAHHRGGSFAERAERRTMKAVVMAGGEGSRLRPLTSSRPKPLVPIANKPVMHHIVDLLRRHGITDVVATLHYLADEIENYFGDGSEMDCSMAYVVEDTPLGTAGAVKLAEPLLAEERFVIVSGDALTDIDIGALRGGARPQRRDGDDRAAARRQSARVRRGGHRRGRAHHAVFGEAVVGRDLLRHDQHRDLRARARRFLSTWRAARRTIFRAIFFRR